MMICRGDIIIKRQTGSTILYDNLLAWQWCKNTAGERGLLRLDHLFHDLVAECSARLSGIEPVQINSAERLYRITKDLAGKEGLSVASFIEKACIEEMESTSGLRLARTSEAAPVQDKGKVPWYSLPKTEKK